MDTVTILNTKLHDIVLPTPKAHKRGGATSCGVRLRPGANEVDFEIIAALDAQPGSAGDAVRGYFESGALREQSDGDKHPANKAQTVKQALTVIAKCNSVDELTKIAVMDTRAEVKAAVDARLIEVLAAKKGK